MNSRPDALVKEQLVEMTQLSPRVIRVWFQNKRCKDKKKTIAMKLQMQQEKVSWKQWSRLILLNKQISILVKNLGRKDQLHARSSFTRIASS